MGVNAGQLQLYSNGVVTGSCRGQINHAVIAVGYGTDGVDYFKIRNSWGTSWGESGYIRLGQNGGSQGTACLFQDPKFMGHQLGRVWIHPFGSEWRFSGHCLPLP